MSDQWFSGFAGALIGGIVTGFFAWMIHRSQQVSFRRDELRRVIAALIDLREDFQTRVQAIADPQLRETAGGTLHSKMQINLEVARTLINSIRKSASSSEYVLLGTELSLQSDFRGAEQYYLKAVKASRFSLNKVFALRSLAGFYFGQGPHRDFDTGRKYFQQAADVLKNPTDAYSIYTQGYTYEIWGINEIANGFNVEGAQKIDRARKYYQDMPDNYPMKSQSLELLTIRLKKAIESNFPSSPLDTGSAAQASSLVEQRSEPRTDSSAT